MCKPWFEVRNVRFQNNSKHFISNPLLNVCFCSQTEDKKRKKQAFILNTSTPSIKYEEGNVLWIFMPLYPSASSLMVIGRPAENPTSLSFPLWKKHTGYCGWNFTLISEQWKLHGAKLTINLVMYGKFNMDLSEISDE